MCIGVLLHLITLNDTYTLGRTPLDEGSAHRSDLLRTHPNSKGQTHTPDLSGIRTHNPSKRAVADPRFRPPGWAYIINGGSTLIQARKSPSGKVGVRFFLSVFASNCFRY